MGVFLLDKHLDIDIILPYHLQKIRYLGSASRDAYFYDRMLQR